MECLVESSEAGRWLAAVVELVGGLSRSRESGDSN